MRHRTCVVVTACSLALASIASGAHSEIWDKELSEADFAAFDRACKDDEDAIRDLIGQSVDINASSNLEVAVVRRMKIQFFDRDCFEFRGICRFDLLSGEAIMPSFFFDERKRSLWYCLWPFPGESEWEVVTRARTVYGHGYNPRLN